VPVRAATIRTSRNPIVTRRVAARATPAAAPRTPRGAKRALVAMVVRGSTRVEQVGRAVRAREAPEGLRAAEREESVRCSMPRHTWTRQAPAERLPMLARLTLDVTACSSRRALGERRLPRIACPFRRDARPALVSRFRIRSARAPTRVASSRCVASAFDSKRGLRPERCRDGCARRKVEHDGAAFLWAARHALRIAAVGPGERSGRRAHLRRVLPRARIRVRDA
jgi:hypothetical protein